MLRFVYLCKYYAEYAKRKHVKNHIKEEIYAVKLVGTGKKNPTTSPTGYTIAL